MATKKTTADILDDVIGMIEESDIMDSLGGSIYKSQNRPIGSADEDVVVNCIASTSEQIQVFSVNINIFVPRIEGEGQNTYYQDTKRIGEVARLLSDFVEEIESTEYDIQPANSVNFDEAIGIHQDYVNVTLRLYRLSQTI